jgi:hypothetical protein
MRRSARNAEPRDWKPDAAANEKQYAQNTSPAKTAVSNDTADVELCSYY